MSELEKKERINITYIGMGYVGIPMACLLAQVPQFYVTGIQRRSERSGWKIDWLNEGKNPFEGDEPGLDELIEGVAKSGKFKVTDSYNEIGEADFILLGVQTPVDEQHVPRYESLREKQITLISQVEALEEDKNEIMTRLSILETRVNG